MKKAREKVAALIGAQPTEIIFTSCGSESDNSAILGTLESYPKKKHIITTRVEHPAVLTLCKYLNKNGYKVTFLPVDKKGHINLEQLEEAITPGTAIVSIMHANNETGVIFPVEKNCRYS